MVYLWPVRRLYSLFTARQKTVRFILRTVSRTYNQLEALFEKQPRRHLRGDFLCIFFCVLQLYWSNYGGCTQVVSFFKYRQCIITAPVVPTACLRVRYTKYVFTRLVHQPLAYASSVLIKQLLIRGRNQYINYIVYFNTIKSHHHPNEHTILYVFRAPGYDSIISLNWYEQFLIKKCLKGR